MKRDRRSADRRRGGRPDVGDRRRCSSRRLRQGQAPEHPRRHDRRHGEVGSPVHAEDAAPARRQGHHLRRRGRLVPALLSGPRDLHHRPVRPQPRRRGQLRAVRLVRDEAPRQHASRLARRLRLRHGDDRQVAERLRSARRPRRGPEGLRHLARAARRVRLRLLQLRDEPRRQAQVVGRQGVRQEARQVRQDRGRRRARFAGDDLRQADRAVRAGALRLLGRGEDQGLLARRDRTDRAATRPRRAQVEEAVLHLVVAGGALIARTSRRR